MGWTSGGGDFWDGYGYPTGGYGGGGNYSSEPPLMGGSIGSGNGSGFNLGMDTAFGGSSGGGGGMDMSWLGPLLKGASAVGGNIMNLTMLDKYSGLPSLPNAELSQMNLDQLGAALKRMDTMSNELTNLTPNELTLRAAANASARNSAAHGVRGGVAAGLAQNAENNAYSLWDQWRRNMLLQSNAQHAQLAQARENLLEQQWQRYLAQYRAERAQQIAKSNEWNSLLQNLIGGVGAVFSSAVGAGPALGYEAGKGYVNLTTGGPETYGGDPSREWWNSSQGRWYDNKK